jgi:hypothetical protein
MPVVLVLAVCLMVLMLEEPEMNDDVRIFIKIRQLKRY